MSIELMKHNYHVLDGEHHNKFYIYPRFKKKKFLGFTIIIDLEPGKSK